MTSVSTILNFEIYNFKTAKQTSRLINLIVFLFFHSVHTKQNKLKAPFKTTKHKNSKWLNRALSWEKCHYSLFGGGGGGGVLGFLITTENHQLT